MTDLVRPVGGQSLFDSDGAGTLSTTIMDSYADLIEENEDALTARTSSHIVTTDAYSDSAEVLLADAESTTGFHVVQPDTTTGTATIGSGSTVLTLTAGTWIAPTPPATTGGYVGYQIRVVGAGVAGADLLTTIVSFQEAVAPITHAVLNTAASTGVTDAVWDFNPGPATSTIHTEGSFSVQSFNKGANGDLTSAFYVNLTEVGYPSGYTVSPGANIQVDVQCEQTANGNFFSVFAVTLASGADLTGTLVSKVYSQADGQAFDVATWYTVTVPVGDLTTIRSIGVKKVVATGNTSNRYRWHLDNIRRSASTPLDQAYGGQDEVTAVIPPDYTTAVPQLPFTASDTKSILDLRPDKIHNGVKWIDDYQIDTTGATDITQDLQLILDSLEDGDILVGSPEHVYESEGILEFNVPGITWDFNGAKLIQKARQLERIIIFRQERCVVKNGSIFGYTASDPANSTGSTMTTVAGSPGNSGTTKILAAVNDEVRIPLISGTSLTFSYSRDYLYRNRFDFKLHDTLPTAGDCVVQIKDARTNAVLQTNTLNLSTTPMYNTIYYTPSDITARLIVTVKKAAGTGNVTITDFIHYGWSSFNTVYEENFGFAVAPGGDDCVVENFLIEGVSGDGIGINTASVSTGAQRFIARDVLIRNVGRQGIAPCGGRNHQFINVTVIHGARHAVDFEPETTPDAIDTCTFENFHIYEPQVGPAFSSAQGWSRTRNIRVDGMFIRMNTGAGAVGGGYNGAQFSNVNIVRTDDSSIDDTFETAINGRNIVMDNWKTDEGISINAGTSPQTDEFGNICNAGGFTLRNIVFTKHPHVGYIQVVAPRVHLENITADAQDTSFDTAQSHGGIGLAADTTYTNVNLALHRTSLPNSWKGIATQAWFPAGLDMKLESLSRVRSLSGGTTKGNNLGAMSQIILAANTTATVVFATKTAQNITFFSLASTTGGTLTPSTQYFYRVAGRPRRGGALVPLAEKSVTLGGSGTAATITATTQYLTSSGFYVDGLTIFRGTATGNYTTRYDVVPTADLNAWGITGIGGNSFLYTVKDLGTTIAEVTANQFSQGYTFPYAATTGPGSTTLVDETGFEPDTSYAVFIEPSWHTTWRVSAKRTNGFDIEFGVPAPTGNGTFSWMIARF